MPEHNHSDSLSLLKNVIDLPQRDHVMSDKEQLILKGLEKARLMEQRINLTIESAAKLADDWETLCTAIFEESHANAEDNPTREFSLYLRDKAEWKHKFSYSWSKLIRSAIHAF